MSKLFHNLAILFDRLSQQRQWSNAEILFRRLFCHLVCARLLVPAARNIVLISYIVLYFMMNSSHIPAKRRNRRSIIAQEGDSLPNIDIRSGRVGDHQYMFDKGRASFIMQSEQLDDYSKQVEKIAMASRVITADDLRFFKCKDYQSASRLVVSPNWFWMWSRCKNSTQQPRFNVRCESGAWILTAWSRFSPGTRLRSGKLWIMLPEHWHRSQLN